MGQRREGLPSQEIKTQRGPLVLGPSVLGPVPLEIITAGVLGRGRGGARGGTQHSGGAGVQ